MEPDKRSDPGHNSHHVSSPTIEDKSQSSTSSSTMKKSKWVRIAPAPRPFLISAGIDSENLQCQPQTAIVRPYYQNTLIPSKIHKEPCFILPKQCTDGAKVSDQIITEPSQSSCTSSKKSVISPSSENSGETGYPYRRARLGFPKRALKSCRICQTNFSTAERWRKHEEKCESLLTCIGCGARFDCASEQMMIHVRDCLKGRKQKMYTCVACPSKTIPAKDYSVHLAKHFWFKYTCPYCSYSGSDRTHACTVNEQTGKKKIIAFGEKSVTNYNDEMVWDEKKKKIREYLKNNLKRTVNQNRDERPDGDSSEKMIIVVKKMIGNDLKEKKHVIEKSPALKGIIDIEKGRPSLENSEGVESDIPCVISSTRSLDAAAWNSDSSEESDDSDMEPITVSLKKSKTVGNDMNDSSPCTFDINQCRNEVSPDRRILEEIFSETNQNVAFLPTDNDMTASNEYCCIFCSREFSNASMYIEHCGKTCAQSFVLI